MVMGTASGVGKSLLTAGLCRIFTDEGYSVAPFKSQNMSNNAHVCANGGEIASSQALQAAACRIEPTVDMNPVLLKPASESGSQVILQGRPLGMMSPQEYQEKRRGLLPLLKESLDRLRRAHDLVILEGAGSPAEINLRESEIANMRTAELADAPVILVGDIEFGGVFAQILGTLEWLTPAERSRVQGFVINKFRGQASVLTPGIRELVARTGVRSLGVVPHLRGLQLPEEDTPSVFATGKSGRVLRIMVVRHPNLANFTDFDALGREEDVALEWVERPGGVMPDALILPGSKNTRADLRRLKESGMASWILELARQGVSVVGLCGGFQMLGRRVRDPKGVEGPPGEEEGLGLLPAVTTFESAKTTARVSAVHLSSGEAVTGYEIHMGVSRVEGEAAFRVKSLSGAPGEHPDGAVALGGKVWGTYLHGVFDTRGFRRHYLNGLRAARGWPPAEGSLDLDLHIELDRWAMTVRSSLDMEAIRGIMGLASTRKGGASC